MTAAITPRGALGALVFFVGLLAACSPSKREAAPPLPSEEVRASLGTIGVASSSQAPTAELEALLRGRAGSAAEGAARGAGQFIAEGVKESLRAGPLGLVVGIVLAPLGAVIGAVAYGSQAVPEDDAKRMERQIVAILNSADIQRDLRRKVIDTARREAGKRLIDVSAAGPTASDPKGEYRSLGARNIDSVMEVNVVRLGLRGLGGANPNLVLFLEARVRLVRSHDNREVFLHDGLQVSGGRRRFSEWGRNDGQMIRRQLAAQLQNLAARIVDEVFLEVQGDWRNQSMRTSKFR